MNPSPSLALCDFAETVTDETKTALLKRLASEDHIDSFREAIIRQAAETLAIDPGELMLEFRRKYQTITCTKANTDTWEVFCLKDAYAERAPICYIVDGIIPLSSLIVGYGAPGSLKSMFFSAMCACVSGGLKFLGRDTMQFPSLWIDLDNGKWRTCERFESIGRAHDLPDDTPFYYVSMPSPWLDAGNPASIEALEKLIKDKGIRFVCIDNLGLICPSADENTDQMVLVMGHLRRLAERTGAAILVIHHQRKGTVKGRAGESLRGHGSIEAAIDLALHIDREEGSDFFTIRSTKTRDVDVPPFAAQFHYEHKPGTTELYKAWFTTFQAVDITSDKAIEKTILDTLRDHPDCNQKQVIESIKSELRAGVNRIRSIYNKMRDEGRLNPKEV